MNLLLAVLLPVLLWEKGPETANTLRQAKIGRFAVPPALIDAWRKDANFSVESLDAESFTSLPAPSLTFDTRTSSATRAPWVNLNGWKFLRQPNGSFVYRANGPSALLAAAEAFTYGARAAIRTDEAGLPPLSQMLEFLSKLKEVPMNPRVNIGFIDDGSPQSGEFMNMLVRRNLLFTVVKSPDPKLDLTVKLGSADYPIAEIANPKLLAEKVRGNLTDEKRLIRIYGSEIVVGRLVGDKDVARLFLINYGALKSPVSGLRVRVLGEYRTLQAAMDGAAECPLLDVDTGSGATEFTLPQIKTLVVVDLKK